MWRKFSFTRSAFITKPLQLMRDIFFFKNNSSGIQSQQTEADLNSRRVKKERTLQIGPMTSHVLREWTHTITSYSERLKLELRTLKSDLTGVSISDRKLRPKSQLTIRTR